MPIDFAASQAANATVYDASQGFSEQLPDFFRLDGRVYWRTSVGDRRNSTFAMDFQNLTLSRTSPTIFTMPEAKKLKPSTSWGWCRI